MDAKELLAGLDAEQREAVTVDASPLAIVAAAGSGKTTVLTRRIAHRIATDPGVQASHVLAVTFTNQAARELEQRLRRAGLRDRIEAGTFHAVALRLLRQRAIDAGQRPPAVASDRVRLLNDALRQVGLRDDPVAVLAELDWSRARCISMANYTSAARAAGRRTPIDAGRLARVADAFDTVKRRRGVIDFDDVLERCLEALGSDKIWAAGVRWRFRHLFVDEAQDLNPLQHGLLEAIRDERPDLCFVGDPRQAIFGFNGADPEIMASAENLYPGLTIVRLRHNYRCTPQITDAGRHVLARAGQADDSIAVAGDGPAVRVVGFGDERDENEGAARLVREFVGTNRRWSSCAILARTTNQLTAVARALERMGIPTNVQGRSTRHSALTGALNEAFALRDPAELATWITGVNAEDGADPIRARVAEAADRYLAQGASMTFRAWVDLHSPFGSTPDDLDVRGRLDAVELLTFHGAKGREWPCVAVIGCEAGLVPHSSAVTPAQRAEEARLLYVACTRAREQLIITWAARRNDRTVQSSPLINSLVASLAAQQAEGAVAPPPHPRPPRPQPDPIYVALVEWRKNAARAADVDPATICSDESLRAVAQHRPRTAEELAQLTDLGPIAASRIAPRIFTALRRAEEELRAIGRSAALRPHAGEAGARRPPVSSR